MSTASVGNPLSTIAFQIPFRAIKAEHVQPSVLTLLDEARKRVDSIAEAEAAATYANTLGALERATEGLEYAMGIVAHLESVVSEPALREAYNAVQGPVAEFYSSIPLNPKLYARLQAFATTEEARNLDATRARFLKKTLDEFRRHGAELALSGKQRLSAINVELTQITTKFAQHVLDHLKDFEWVTSDPAALAGLPESALAAARQGAQAKGVEGYRFTLQQPSYIAVLTYLDDAAVRERFFRAYTRIAVDAPYQNFELIRQIVRLRQEKAKLLGYGSFADLVLEDRMAKRGDAAVAFLKELEQRSNDAFARETRELQDFRQQLEGDTAKPLAAWDIAYYTEKLRKARFDFDEEALRPYFPMPAVIDGLFALVNKIFGITVEAARNDEVWAPDVLYYGIRDQDGTHLGSFYADWYPRESKRGGAWMNSLLTGGPSEEAFRPHLGLMCGNMTPPIGDKPALLTHREVETVFHEFGHLLHHCLSKVEVRSLSGTNVAWDFVELPSQIMENWCWERESLDLFARHHDTGEALPEDLFQKMRRARSFRAASQQMRQISFGTVDLQLHTGSALPESSQQLQRWARDLMMRYASAPLPEDYGMLASFLHLFSDPVGYAAGYYSYKWAEVLDADAFQVFLSKGIFDRETGSAFRRHILESGNREDPGVLYRRFAGRDPEIAPLLRRQGLLSDG